MTRMMWIGLVATVLLGVRLGAQKPQAADTLLQTAIKKEVVDGDLKGAIEQYKKLAQSSNRAVAAQALLHLAGCYQKSGDAEAKKVYERIVREFGDQAQVASAARAQLGAPSGEYATRRIWTAPPGSDLGPYSNASADGRLITYIDYSVDGLFVHDLVTGTTRQVADSPEPGKGIEFPEENAFSPDGKQLAYAWKKGKEHRWEVRAVDLSGTGVPKFRRVYDNPEVDWIGPDDWSRDGKWISVQLARKDGTYQFGLLSADGSLRVLKTWQETHAATRLLFSPDGRYLAYDTWADQARTQRDVFMMALDTGVETPVVVSPNRDDLIGWSPDGGRLIFASNRTGGYDIWSQAVANGKAQGAPELLRYGMTGSRIRLTSSATSLTYQTNNLGPSIRVADFDFRAGQFLSAPVNPVQELAFNNLSPAWSPDGKSLAYLSGRNRHEISILAIDSDKIRKLAPNLRWVGYDLAWSPDARSFAVSGLNLNECAGIFRVDGETGEVSPLAMAPEGRRFMSALWSVDGRKLYYRDDPGNDTGTTAFKERDLASGAERELIRRDTLGGLWLSPDGKYIATGTTNADGKPGPVVISLADGQTKELFTGQENLRGIRTWAPDSKSLFIGKGTGDAWELWRIPIDGSAPQKLDLKIDPSFGAFRVSSDGRKVAFQVQPPPRPAEVWVTENFLPAPKPGK